MANDLPEYFTEMITNVSMANGVFRVTFAQQEANNTSRPVVRLIIPASQIAGLISGLRSAASDLENRVKTGPATPPSPPRPAPAKAAAAPAKPAKRAGARKAKK